MKRIEDPMLKLILAKTQVSNAIELIKDNEFEQYMSTKLWSVYYELERQESNLQHQQKTERDSRQTG
jgi:NOL1/NOP2/fmu family ribosome biogenesis protein